MADDCSAAGLCSRWLTPASPLPAQVVCIALFLFYMLNTVPGMLKNALIALWSTKFVSADIDGVLRIHHWRSCSFWAGLWRRLTRCTPWPYVPFALETVNREMLDYFTGRAGGRGSAAGGGFFLPLSRQLCPWSADPPPAAAGGAAEAPPAGDWVVPPGQAAEGGYDEEDTRLAHEVAETRAFFRRKLAQVRACPAV